MIGTLFTFTLAAFCVAVVVVLIWSAADNRGYNRGYDAGRRDGGATGFQQGRHAERKDQAGDQDAPFTAILTTGDGSFERPFTRTAHDLRCAAFRSAECDCAAPHPGRGDDNSAGAPEVTELP